MKKKKKVSSGSSTRQSTIIPLTETEKMDLSEILRSDGYKALKKVFEYDLQGRAIQLTDDSPEETEHDLYRKKLKVSGAREAISGVFNFLDKYGEEKSKRKEA